MKDQFVIAYLADLSMVDTVVSHAAYLAEMLKKGLILLYVEDAQYCGTPYQEAAKTLVAVESRLAHLHPAHVTMKGNSKDVINSLPTMLNGVVAVAGVNPDAKRGGATHPRQVLRLFSECKIAYLTVQESLSSRHQYDTVGYGVDFRKESKEKLIWASYFARFNHSRLNMYHFDYTDEGLRTKWHNNILFMNKFFKGLSVQYSDRVVQGRALFPETIICSRAAEECGLLISVTTDTRDLDIIEWFAGVQESRTICNVKRMPILFLNPRNDIYVLCD